MITELDEAIKHCKEKAEELKNEAENSKKKEEVRFTMRSKFSESLHNSSGADFDVGNIDLTEYNDCLECAKDHEQLAEWLTELQEARKIIWDTSLNDACKIIELRKLIDYQ